MKEEQEVETTPIKKNTKPFVVHTKVVCLYLPLCAFRGLLYATTFVRTTNDFVFLDKRRFIC